MRKTISIIGAFLLLSLVGADKTPTQWAVNMTNIEACSCEQFCTCYFSGHPTPALAEKRDHAEPMMYCRFNNAFRINSGNYGDTKLDSVKFWMAGDLGGDFSKGFEWAVITFEPSATPEQRAGVQEIVSSIFGGTWKSFTVGPDAKIDWSASDNSAEARLDGGNGASITLKNSAGDKPVVIQNLKFWHAPRNDGVKVMKSELEAYKLGEHPFEYKNTNGFVTTIDMNSEDAAKAGGK